MNDGGKSFQGKNEVRQLYLDIMDVSKDSPRRTNPNGIYFSQFLDKQKKIKLILLDNRFSNDDYTWTDLITGVHEENCNLGEAQSEWLKNELESSTAEYTVIGAGVMMIPDDRFCEHFYKKTREFLMTIRNPKTKIFLISGDVHHAEFTQDLCSKHIHGYPIREFTSSGLTHGLA